MSDEAHFSAEQPRPRTAPRLSSPDGDSGRPRGNPCPPGARPSQAERLISIRLRRDFLAANAAKRRATTGFVLLVRDRCDNDPARRLGVTVTKKIGNAVVRNRMKRRFRALARDVIADRGLTGADHILIGRAGGVERDYALLKAELTAAVDKLNR
jgi:ribonuclease P protein component